MNQSLCWRTKGEITDMGNGRIAKRISTTFLAWSWAYTPGEFWIWYPWKTDCTDDPMNGLSELWFCNSSQWEVMSVFPLLESELSGDLLWPKECGRSNCTYTSRGVSSVSIVSWKPATSIKTSPTHHAGEWDKWLSALHPTFLAAAG